MARSEFRTKLPLDRWARILGIHPLHFNQVTFADLPNGICDQAWFTHEWQDSDRVGRDAIALAIQQAERTIEEYLGYRLLPTWEVDERAATVRASRPELVNISASDVRGYKSSVRTKWGELIQGGIEGKALLAAASAIVYTDSNGDGYSDLATVTVAVASGQEPCEIAAFYPGKAGDDAWEIRPINVSVAGLVATITFARELAVLEALMEGLTPAAVDGAAAGNFLTTVDVYRRYNDLQIQASFLWEPLAGVCGCGNGDCVNCAYTTQTGCILPRDVRLGIAALTPATWNAVTESFDSASWTVARLPDQVRLYYLAGHRDLSLDCPHVTLDAYWAQTVAYFAAALLDRPPCECSALKSQIERWARDLAFSDGATELATYNISSADLDNPFGTTAGAVYAWKRVMGRGAAIGESVEL